MGAHDLSKIIVIHQTIVYGIRVMLVLQIMIYINEGIQNEKFAQAHIQQT